MLDQSSVMALEGKKALGQAEASRHHWGEGGWKQRGEKENS